MDVETLRTRISGIISEFPQVSLVYLFGSQVSGKTGPMSDFDLAIFCDPGADLMLHQVSFSHAISQLVDFNRVDVVILNRALIELAFNIISNGVILYQRSNAIRVEFEANVMGRYGDYLPVLRQFRIQIVQGDPHGKRVHRNRKALGRTERTLVALNRALRKKAGGV